MRIVGGRHRSRSLTPLPDRSVRPTTDRTREAMFNILSHRPWGPEGGNAVDGAIVLDAFIGSGALALEALSRGAERAFGFDTSPQALALARKNAATLGETSKLTVRRADALKPPLAEQAATLIFLDPPYGQDLVGSAIDALHDKGWIAEDTIIVIETPTDEMPALPDGFEHLDERTYGGSRLNYWRARR